MPDLRLERRDQPDETGVVGPVVFTPPIDEDYWSYRVVLSEHQAIVGFPKFSTIGIGFAVEEDWNTNLPYTSETDKIFQHIAHNKGDDRIADVDVKHAIRLVQDAASADREAPDGPGE
jgi:hypothetical protein